MTEQKILEFIIRDCKVCDGKTYFRYIGNEGVAWRRKYLYNCVECSYGIELYGDDFTKEDLKNKR